MSGGDSWLVGVAAGVGQPFVGEVAIKSTLLDAIRESIAFVEDSVGVASDPFMRGRGELIISLHVLERTVDTQSVLFSVAAFSLRDGRYLIIKRGSRQ